VNKDEASNRIALFLSDTHVRAEALDTTFATHKLNFRQVNHFCDWSINFSIAPIKYLYCADGACAGDSSVLAQLRETSALRTVH
jgi:hypothetical protein